jgi:undecaprenyl-diphosphatase
MRWLMAIMIIVTGGLSIAARGENVLPGDVAFTRFVQGLDSPVARSLATFGNWFGSARAGIPLTAILILALLVTRHTTEAAFFGTVTLLRSINWVLKAACESPRPTSDLVRVDYPVSGWGFPSGHAMGATIFCGGVIWITLRLITVGWLRWSIIAISVALAAITGFARIYVGVHWPTDVLGGFLWGSVIVLIAAEFFLRITGPRQASVRGTTAGAPAPLGNQSDPEPQSVSTSQRFFLSFGHLATLRVTARARWSASCLSAILLFLIYGKLFSPTISLGSWTLHPDFTRYWWYQFFQISLTIILLTVVDALLEKRGGLSRTTHSMIVTAALADALGNVAHGYRTFDWYDKVLHAYTGATFTFAAADVLRGTGWTRLRTHSRGNALIPAAVSVLLAGVGWEVYEFLGDILLHTERVRDWRDTAYDVIAATCGALIASTVLRYKLAAKQPAATGTPGIIQPAIERSPRQRPPSGP